MGPTPWTRTRQSGLVGLLGSGVVAIHEGLLHGGGHDLAVGGLHGDDRLASHRPRLLSEGLGRLLRLRSSGLHEDDEGAEDGAQECQSGHEHCIPLSGLGVKHAGNHPWGGGRA